MIRRTPIQRTGIKRSRYGVKRVTDSTGRSYASKAERAGIADLRLEHPNLEEQVAVSFHIGPDGRAILRCLRPGLTMNVNHVGGRIEGARWDAAYRTYSGQIVFVDIKGGFYSEDFKRKARWMEALGYPVTVLDYGKRRGR